MSQQEFVPQSQHLLHDDEIYHPQHPYNWSEKPNKEAAPRDEPPSSYDEPMMQRGYQAQEQIARTQQQQFSPDGDAYEQKYRIHNQYNSYLPLWAKPQPRKKNIARLLLLTVLIVLLMKPALLLIGFLLVAIAGFIGIAFVALVLPLIFVVGLVSIFLLILRVAIRS